MMDIDIQFSWNAGYKAVVRDCQIIIAILHQLRNANANASRQTLKIIKEEIEEMLKSWEEGGK